MNVLNLKLVTLYLLSTVVKHCTITQLSDKKETLSVFVCNATYTL